MTYYYVIFLNKYTILYNSNKYTIVQSTKNVDQNNMVFVLIYKQK